MMRRVPRLNLDTASRIELFRRTRAVQNGEDARSLWKGYRGTNAGRIVAARLGDMAGARSRCFYCSDSRGADIDHFIPIAVDVSRTFAWPNLIWVCPECNRKKGMRFPLSPAGEPLLIDPTCEDPWRFLVLDTTSGWIAPRFHNYGPDPRGAATLGVLETINYEATAEGRARTIERFLTAVGQAVEARDRSTALRALKEAVRQDEYGIASWFVYWEGSRDRRLADLRLTMPNVWRRLTCMVATF